MEAIQPELQEAEEELLGPQFNPPLYKQRYQHVSDILKEEQISKVVEYGIAECNVVRYYKRVDNLTQITGVDIDRSVLESGSRLIGPLTTDYLVPRTNPLRIQLFCGSIVDYDVRLKHADAVTLIEVIEHFEEDILKAFPFTVFGKIKPRLVVITTPNSEFNILFTNFSGMRHPDHKFEWTRKEFHNWCEEIAEHYGYILEFGGVGDPPDGSEDVGHCSQLAIFRRLAETADNTEQSDAQPYQLVAERIHPHKHKLDLEERILNEVDYYVGIETREAMRCHENDSDTSEPSEEQSSSETKVDVAEDMDTVTFTIPLTLLLGYPKLKAVCDNEDLLRDILRGSGRQLAADDTCLVHVTEYEDGRSYGWYSEHRNSELCVSDDDCPELESSSVMMPPGGNVCEELWD